MGALSHSTRLTALTVSNNAQLTSLHGLHNILFAFGAVTIEDNDALPDISALASLATAGHVVIRGNRALTTLARPSLPTSTLGSLVIEGNLQLRDLNGLENLRNFTAVDSAFGGFSLLIANNPSLTQIDALTFVTSASGGVAIRNNTQLTQVDGLYNLQSTPFVQLQVSNRACA